MIFVNENELLSIAKCWVLYHQSIINSIYFKESIPLHPVSDILSNDLVCTALPKQDGSEMNMAEVKDRDRINKLKTSSTKAGNKSPAKCSRMGIKPFVCLKG